MKLVRAAGTIEHPGNLQAVEEDMELSLKF
jgi:hypothetical protein